MSKEEVVLPPWKANEAGTFSCLPPEWILHHVVPFLDRVAHNRLAATNRNFKNLLRDSIPWPCTLRAKNHLNRFHSLQFSPCGTWLAAGCSDGHVRLWHVRTGEERQVSLQGHNPSEVVVAVSFSRDGRWLASTATDHTVKIWSMDQLLAAKQHAGSVLRILYPCLVIHAPYINCLDFSPDNSLLATGGFEGICLWSTSTGQVVHRIPGVSSSTPRKPLYAVQFASSSHILWTTGSNMWLSCIESKKTVSLESPGSDGWFHVAKSVTERNGHTPRISETYLYLAHLKGRDQLVVSCRKILPITMVMEAQSGTTTLEACWATRSTRVCHPHEVVLSFDAKAVACLCASNVVQILSTSSCGQAEKNRGVLCRFSRPSRDAPSSHQVPVAVQCPTFVPSSSSAVKQLAVLVRNVNEIRFASYGVSDD